MCGDHLRTTSGEQSGQATQALLALFTLISTCPTYSMFKHFIFILKEFFIHLFVFFELTSRRAAGFGRLEQRDVVLYPCKLKTPQLADHRE